MAKAVTTGALLKCSYGVAPTPLMVLPVSRVLAKSMPMANIMDNKPFVNILPFVLCNSSTNPAVIAARAAAFGATVPGPCVPAIVAPWSGGNSKVLVGGKPAVTNESKCRCTWNGSITVVNTPASSITL